LLKIDVIRLDPRFDKLVPLNVKIEKIASGHKWVEGPVWNRKEGYLLFSDIPNNAVYKWQEGKGVSLFLKPSGYTGKIPLKVGAGSNGLTYDPDSRLVLPSTATGALRLEKRPKTTLVDRFDGKRINSPNDLAKANGDLYFTDPPFGLPKSFDDSRKELPFQGVYRLSKNGQLTLITKDLRRPTESPSRRTKRSLR
jgi:gluconolactonase